MITLKKKEHRFQNQNKTKFIAYIEASKTTKEETEVNPITGEPVRVSVPIGYNLRIVKLGPINETIRKIRNPTTWERIQKEIDIVKASY